MLTWPSLLHLCAADLYVRNAVRDLLGYVRKYKLDGIDLNAEVRCRGRAGRVIAGSGGGSTGCARLLVWLSTF